MLEIIGFTIDGCIKAARAGAHRIELCDNPAEGGTTPSYGFIQQSRKALSINLFPIIRPRGGDFVYGDDEFEIMLKDTIVCKNAGCDGIVTGMLSPDGRIDMRTKLLVELAYPMEVTFHRAFDRVKDPFNALEQIIEFGCTRILTSGLKPDALSGAALIKKLVEKADDRIIIMPGSGVNSKNIREIKKITNAKEFHSSARIKKAGMMSYQNKDLNETPESYTVDEADIKKMLDELAHG